MKEYIYEIETPIIRRIAMMPSAISLIILAIIFFIVFVIIGPKDIKIHLGYFKLFISNGIMSMWKGVKHIPMSDLSKQFYK